MDPTGPSTAALGGAKVSVGQPPPDMEPPTDSPSASQGLSAGRSPPGAATLGKPSLLWLAGVLGALGVFWMDKAGWLPSTLFWQGVGLEVLSIALVGVREWLKRWGVEA